MGYLSKRFNLPEKFMHDNPEFAEIQKAYNQFVKDQERFKGKHHDYLIPEENIKYFNKTLSKVIKTIEQLYIKSVQDTKTGLYDAVFFNENLSIEFEDAKEKGKPISLIMIDIDHFKKINDIFGHIIGDAIIVEFANILRQTTPKTNIVARFGGDEFIVLVKGDIEDSKKLVENLIEKMKQNEIMRKYKIHFSGGISLIKEKDKNIIEFKSRVDKLLYKAKRTGRNKVIFG